MGYEEREKSRLEDQRRGAGVIIEQIKDRQAQRMREEGSRDQERAFILKQIEALKAEEVEQQRQKERRLGEQAKFERDEFERIIEVQLQQEEAERQRQAEEKSMRVQHSQEIR